MADFFRQKETIEDTIAFLQESTQTLVEFHANIVGGELTNRDEELGTRLEHPSPPPPFHLPRVCGSLDGGAFCVGNATQNKGKQLSRLWTSAANGRPKPRSVWTRGDASMCPNGVVGALTVCNT